MGATIVYRNGYYFASAPPGGLRGARIEFPIVTVMGTENAMLAATLARGTTVIDNAALEPEVDDLIAMLCAMGARIERTAERRIEIEGVDRLGGAEHRVMGDRLEAETFAIAAAITRGEVTLRGVDPAHLGAFLEVCDRMGVAYEADAPSATPRDPRPADGRAARGRRPDRPLPGLRHRLPGAALRPHDPGRWRLDHPRDDLRGPARPHARAGQDGRRHRARSTSATPASPGRHALHGAEVAIADLRAGATLILAALAATGTSVISGIEHVDRGYEQIEAKLVALGAQINRIEA